MEARAELEQHDRSVGRDEHVAARRMQAPDRHVASAGGVTDVHRIGEQGAGIIEPRELGAKPREPLPAHPPVVDNGLPGLDVEPERRDFDGLQLGSIGRALPRHIQDAAHDVAFPLNVGTSVERRPREDKAK